MARDRKYGGERRFTIAGLILLMAVLVGTLVTETASALPILYGYVWNASDDTDANGRLIRTYQPDAPSTYDMNDTIGPTGDSAEGNGYLFNCYEGGNPFNDCDLGDTITYELVNITDNYVIQRTTITITQDMIDNGLHMLNFTMALNLSPNINFHYPLNGSSVNNTVLVNLSVINVTLFDVDTVYYMIGNGSGNYSKEATSGYTVVNESATNNFYNDTFNSSKFAGGSYLFYVVANNTMGAVNTTWINITIANNPDLMINSTYISFSDESPLEDQNVTISATIFNIGQGDATAFNVSFFEGNYSTDIQIGLNQTVDSLASGANATVAVNWTAKQGTYEINVVVDPPIDSSGIISESDETNNYDTDNISISSWHTFVGNLTGSLVLSTDDGSKIINWQVLNTSGGKVYIADSDSSISFDSLIALGRNMSNASTVGDFDELDDVLATSNNTDSINDTFTSSGTVINEYNFTTYGERIFYVAITNSTNSSQFFTGVLWDSDDDTDEGGTAGEYDSTDREDVVFVTLVNDARPGRYGVYDYEIKVPANLRNYVSGGGSSSVALYGEVI